MKLEFLSEESLNIKVVVLRKKVWKTLKNYMHKVLKGLLTSHGIVVKAEQMEFDFFARVPCVTCQ